MCRDRIIFIVSINKVQLIHTISRYYGERFDATAYLNKFFDVNIDLPIIKLAKQLPVYNVEQRYFRDIASNLKEYFNLPFRDSLIYTQYIQSISNMPVAYINDYSGQGCCLSIFVPIIIILDILDQERKNLFLSGKENILDELSNKLPAISNLIERFCDIDDETHFESGYKKIHEVYDYTFGNSVGYNDITIEISSHIKEICIRICNGFYDYE